ncbi:hypothetical protein FRB99_006162 [Tulasnella sp. 403]|nr:hypothetical protein FRB99_006162 [Tulasnella sp. 403]
MSATAKSNPFRPKLLTPPIGSPSESSQDVTIPYIPELFDPNYLEKLFPETARSAPAAPAKPPPSHPFMDALRREANMSRTDNNAPAFASTKSLVLDAFSTLDQNTSTEQVHKFVRESWSEDPQLTLKVIWDLRSIQEGKGAKHGFYRAFGWLYNHHPKTAIGNLEALVDPIIERKHKPNSEKSKDHKGSMNDTSSEWTEVDRSEDVHPTSLTHGYYKDLLNLLCLAVSDSLGSANLDFSDLQVPRPFKDREDIRRRRRAVAKAKKQEAKRIGKAQATEKYAIVHTTTQRTASELAAVARKKTHLNVHERLVGKLISDVKFKALYIAVSRIFAKSLATDNHTLKKLTDPATPSAEKLKLKWSLTPASKWGPSLQCFHDRTTNVATGIALAMYANGDMEGLRQIRIDAPLGVADAHTIRGYYRRWIISPLRRYMDITEIKMSDNGWNQVGNTKAKTMTFILKPFPQIQYPRVSSQCMARNKQHFFKHDEPRLSQYLDDVAIGKKTISAGHGSTALGNSTTLGNSTKTRNHYGTSYRGKQPPGQWNTMLGRLRESGTLDNCLAVCDVSGSMGRLCVPPGWKIGSGAPISPIFPAVALSLVLAQLASPPFQNSFITFSSNPKIVALSPSPDAKLSTLIQEIGRAYWEMNTDFEAVFLKLLLPMAIKHQLKREDMVKRLFVFSDMQFDQARPRSGTSWETNHERIVKAFNKAGYDVPEIVYWNLAGRVAAKPVTKDTPGVAMVAGFSGNLLKLFMENEEPPMDEWTDVDKEGQEIAVTAPKPSISPLDTMRKALSNPCYDGLRVLD